VISTIAVGTDGTATAGKAVEVAGELARRFDAKLVLLSAFKDLRRPASGESVELQWATNKPARVRELLSRAEDAMRREGIDCTTRVAEGDAADVLVELASECDADLLVIGNKGMQRRVLGSVPNSVAHKAPCSVLVVKTT
jgi:nucleotide-binding universal stress UspA family protein